MTLLTTIRYNRGQELSTKFNHLHNDSTEFKFRDNLKIIQYNNTKDWINNNNPSINKKDKRRVLKKKRYKGRFNQDRKLLNCKIIIINKYITLNQAWAKCLIALGMVDRTCMIMNLITMSIRKWTGLKRMHNMITWTIRNFHLNTWNASVVMNFQKSHLIVKLVEQLFVKTAFISCQEKKGYVHAAKRNSL